MRAVLLDGAGMSLMSHAAQHLQRASLHADVCVSPPWWHVLTVLAQRRAVHVLLLYKIAALQDTRNMDAGNAAHQLAAGRCLSKLPCTQTPQAATC
jgi:hypothetical protein